MRVLNSFTGTEKTDLQIQSPVQKLFFSILTNAPIFTELSKIKIKLDKVGAKGVKPIISLMSLQHLLEICAIHEGFVEVTPLDEDGNYTLKGTVDIARNGALRCDNNEYLSLDMYEIPQGSYTTITDIYTLDSPVYDDSYIQYDPIQIQGGIVKAVPLDNSFGIALPIDQNLNNVNIDYPEKSVNYTEAELQQVMRDINDLSYVKQLSGFNLSGFGTAFGYLSYGVLEYPAARLAQITPKNANTNVTAYVLRDLPF